MKSILVVLLIGLVTLFQNCAQSTFETALSSDNDISSMDLNSTANSEAEEESTEQIAATPISQSSPQGQSQQTNSTSEPTNQQGSTPVAQAPICAAFSELNTKTGSCESCTAKGLTYSASEKKCVATCNGGFIIRLRQTDATSIEKVMNPMGYNIVTSFLFIHNGNRIGIGDYYSAAGVVPSSQFYKDLNAVVTSGTAEQGVANAFHHAIKLANPNLNGTLSLGETYTTYETVKQQAVLTENREIVYSAAGTFDVRSAGWKVYGNSPASHAFMTRVYCK